MLGWNYGQNQKLRESCNRNTLDTEEENPNKGSDNNRKAATSHAPRKLGRDGVANTNRYETDVSVENFPFNSEPTDVLHPSTQMQRKAADVQVSNVLHVLNINLYHSSD